MKATAAPKRTHQPTNSEISFCLAGAIIDQLFDDFPMPCKLDQRKLIAKTCDILKERVEETRDLELQNAKAEDQETREARDAELELLKDHILSTYNATLAALESNGYISKDTIAEGENLLKLSDKALPTLGHKQNPSEYEAISNEMHTWQQARIAVLGFDVAILGAILAGKFSGNQSLVASIFILLVLIASVIVMHYATLSIVIIGAYIEVFHEPSRGGWQSRLSRLHYSGVMGFSKIMNWTYRVASLLALLPILIQWKSIIYYCNFVRSVVRSWADHSESLISIRSLSVIVTIGLCIVVVALFVFLQVLIGTLRRSGGKARYKDVVSKWRQLPNAAKSRSRATVPHDTANPTSGKHKGQPGTGGGASYRTPAANPTSEKHKSQTRERQSSKHRRKR